MLSIGRSCGRLGTQFRLVSKANIILNKSVPTSLSSSSLSIGGASHWIVVATRPFTLVQNRYFASKVDDNHTKLHFSNDDSKSEKDSQSQQQQQHTSESWKDRADHMRSNVTHHYQEFRQHPGASARAGAHSVGELIRQYGPVAVGTYFSVYITTLAALFAGVQSGALDPISLFEMLGQVQDPSETKNTVDLVVNFLRSHSLTENWADTVAQYPSFANLAVAWIAVKFTEPIRLAATIAITPRVARFIGLKRDEPDPVKD